MRVRTIEAAGAATRYYEAGEGPAVLLVHGVGSSADVWVRTIPALARRFRVVAPDILGHGMTGTGPYAGGPPQPAMVDHLLDFADRLAVGSFAICGSSYGAMLALLTYFRAKEKVTRLALISSASATLPPEERIAAVRAAYRNTLSAYDAPSLESAVARMRGQFHDPDRIPADVALVQLTLFSQPGMRGRFETFMQGLMDPATAGEYRTDDRFAEIEVPTLMLWGGEDRSVRRDLAMALARQARDARFVEAEGCGHVPHLERPEVVNPLLERFLTGEAWA